MRKIFALILAVMFVFVAGNAFAEATVEGSYGAEAASCDFSYSVSLHGWGNDWAIAGGTGSAMAGTITGGTGEHFAYQTGGAFAIDKTKACTYAFDFGLTSMAGAYVKNEGAAFTGGMVIAPNGWSLVYYGGHDGDAGYYQKIHGNNAGEIKYFRNGHPQPNENNEWVFLGKYQGWSNGPVNDYVLSSSMITGSVFQENGAQEVGYKSGTGAVAVNTSGGEFIAGNFDGDAGKNCAAAGTGIAGSIETSGRSFVNVDPYGCTQSAFATTSNSVSIEVCRPDFYCGGVYGNGFAQTAANANGFSGAASAGGTSSFGYCGAVSGAGSATSFSTATVGVSQASASSCGSSFATSR